MRQLGDILLEQGLAAPEQVRAAEADQLRLGRPFARLLVEQGVITEVQLVRALARQAGLEFVDLAEHPIDVVAVRTVPAALCRRHSVLPIGFDDGRVVLAMADAGNVFAVDDVRSVVGTDVRAVVATRDDLTAAIDRYCRADAEMGDLTTELGGPTSSPAGAAVADLARLREVVDDAPMVRFVNLLITQAVQDRASDIHIEPTESDLRIRYRIDGVLHEVMRSPQQLGAGVTSRLKVMADMDIAERRRPQDGRMSVDLGGRTVDLRVATLPTVWGEKVVMRILDNSTARLGLTDLAFSDGNLARFQASFTKPYGMVLVTGPTGSGKSTTLYATLNVVSNPTVNVITVEDPVEYRLPGINQVQVNPKAGLTFAGALRSILRSDPDIVLLGEIRDHETAQIAIEASLTGHLVLSTLHTNDAASAVTRLVEMGIEPFLVGSALDAVVAQRLARKLCATCAEAYIPAPEELIGARYPWTPGQAVPTLHRPVGCALCSRTGYKGRVALHEVLTVDEEVERLAVAGASTADIDRLGRERGMVSLRQDGWGKVARGLTTLEEVLRVVV
ncbi:MAG: Type IV fimbrial assembly, ATPase PilB [uncultured Quadrisphaera sp.]|uniref:Type IV fimbrial assembly, ATPase PilB n=1 Tax=uncultured Quadrisphaera sp. TaxID=904978 RepID=A0A6J4NIZ4_9ACTN|nr:MAG: Type IV fimbrial assembly, ATPase PilB [uncultured Quadrisphaera sp.]